MPTAIIPMANISTLAYNNPIIKQLLTYDFSEIIDQMWPEWMIMYKNILKIIANVVPELIKAYSNDPFLIG